MKTGTVRWFNLQKGYGFIHPDDGSPNILVRMSAVASAGMADLKEGQRVIFEIQRDERTGNASAESLKRLALATTAHLEGSFAATNPFDVISAFISSTMLPVLAGVVSVAADSLAPRIQGGDRHGSQVNRPGTRVSIGAVRESFRTLGNP
jgi:CspA family cold shock protein